MRKGIIAIFLLLIKDRISQRGKGKFIFKPYLLEPPDLREVGVDLKNSLPAPDEG